MLYHRVEDRGVGVMLNGFNVTYLDGKQEFQPCVAAPLVLSHMHRVPWWGGLYRSEDRLPSEARVTNH